MTVIHRLAKLKWVADVLFPFTVALMEAFWVYPWLAWISKWPMLAWQRPPLSLASLILLLSISFFATRILIGSTWSLARIQLSIIACGLVAILIVIRIEYGAGFGLSDAYWFLYMTRIFLDSFSHLHPVVIAVATGVYLWWRGITWGRSSLHFDNIYRSFAIGLAALVVLIITWGVSLGAGSLESLASTTGLYITGFFFFGLTALALSHLEAIRQRMPQEEMVRVFARRWLPTVLGVIASIVFLAVGITSIFSSELVTSLARLFTIISDFLFQALSYLFIPLGYLAEGLIYVAQFILNLLRHVGLVKASQTGKLPAPPELPEPRELQVPAEAVLAMKWALFALLAIVVAFLFARAIIRYLSSRAQDDVEETHESLWSWEGFRADLRLLFSIVRQRFKRKRREVAPASRVPGWYIRDDIQSMSSIREIYQCLLWEAACAGMARQLHETPYEYARRLGKAVPDGSVPLGELTDLYVAIRYGEIEAEDYQVGHANNLWKVLKFLLRRPSETV